MKAGNSNSSSVYLKLKTKIWVDEDNDPKEVFDDKHFSHAVELLNAMSSEPFSDEKSTTKKNLYDPGCFVYKILPSTKESIPGNIRIEDIQGVYYSTQKGEIKYIENPTQ